MGGIGPPSTQSLEDELLWATGLDFGCWGEGNQGDFFANDSALRVKPIPKLSARCVLNCLQTYRDFNPCKNYLAYDLTTTWQCFICEAWLQNMNELLYSQYSKCIPCSIQCTMERSSLLISIDIIYKYDNIQVLQYLACRASVVFYRRIAPFLLQLVA